MSAKLVLLLSAVLLVTWASAMTTKEKLAGDLLRGYMKEIDPGNTPLKMGLSYMCADLDPETRVMTSKLMEKYTWIDTRLTWYPADYEGIELFRLPAKKIWTPDVKLYNTEYETEARDEVNTVIYSNGSVLWMPLVRYKTPCTLSQTEEDKSALCKIQLGSWTYDANNLDLQLQDTGFDTFMYLDTCPYVISDATVRVDKQIYPCCPEPYASLHASFKLSPRA
jgi:hypothetical protein